MCITLVTRVIDGVGIAYTFDRLAGLVSTKSGKKE